MLTQARNTKSRDGRSRAMPVKAATVIHQGSLVVNDAGVAAPGRTALNLVALGRAEATADNSGGAAGAISAGVETGTFLFANSGADPVTAASIGKNVFIVDDETVAATDGAGTRSIAGRCFDLDDGGVWVTIG